MRDHPGSESTGVGAAVAGHSKLSGQVPGPQAEYLVVPFADT
ncbi:MAG TPA: hypothetical protein VE152_03175 [Acidimicrobiales bacterium]|nr:hypothetical protein [Acidimicrobiales bacterium]